MVVEPQIDFIFFMACVAVGQGIFFGGYLILGQIWRKRWDQLFLGIILLMLAFEIVHDLLVHSRLIFYALFFHGLGGFFRLALYPTIIMYLLALKRKNKWIPYFSLLYIPFLVSSYFWLNNYFSIGTEQKETLLRAFYSLGEVNTGVRNTPEFWFFNLLYPMVILVIALLVLRKDQKIDGQSSLKITYLLIGGLVFSMAIKSFSFQDLGLFGISDLEWIMDILFWALSLLLIGILLFRDYEKVHGRIPLLDRIKYRNSGLTATKAQGYIERAKTLMNEEELYTIKNFKLQELADRLEINSSYLSQSFSQVMDTSFTDFVNGYRIQKARKLLAQSESRKFTIEAIAHHVGFNSRSAFYRAFAKHADGLPKDFHDKTPIP